MMKSESLTSSYLKVKTFPKPNTSVLNKDLSNLSSNQTKIEDKVDIRNQESLLSTHGFLSTLKIFLDVYSLAVLFGSLTSLVLPSYISLPIGAAIASTSLLLKDKPFIQKIKEKLSKISLIPEKIGGIFRIIPFKYPTIVASNQHRNEIIQILDKLPLKVVNNLSTIEINNEITNKYDALGLVFDYLYKTPVYLNSNPYPYTFEYVLTHEIGHTVDLGFKFAPLNYKSSLFILPKYPWGIKNFVSSYAETSSTEDFAESFAHFLIDPQKLQKISPYKYHFIKHVIQQNPLEKLFDNKLFRTIGKKISEITGKFPVIRNVIEIFGFYTANRTISEGIEKLLEAKESNNKDKLIDSKLTLLLGLLLTKKSIYSLPLLPLKFLGKKLLNNKKVKNSEIYEKVVDFMDKGLSLALSFTVGPLWTSLYQALETNSSFKDKFLVFSSGFSSYLAIQLLKFTFPVLIPFLSMTQAPTSLLITEVVKNLTKVSRDKD